MKLPNVYPRSLLRYPGGKTRAVQAITALIPESETTLCSPFLGGASVELALSTTMQIFGYDSFSPLVAFWQAVQAAPAILADAVQAFYPLAKQAFYDLQHSHTSGNDMEQAAAFYVLNRASFSGTTLSGGMSPNHPRFTLSSIQRLVEFQVKRFWVKQLDFQDSIPLHDNAFLYCDPPYLIPQKLYGVKGNTHAGFDHAALADLLHKRGRWLLSYNDCAAIRELYKGYRITTPSWAYGMGKTKTSNEVLIFSKDLP